MTIPLVRMILAGKNPAQRAEELVGGCKLLGLVESRKKLFDGGPKAAVEVSQDPMIRLTQPP